MIELIATAESVKQADDLLAAGIDTLYIGEETYGLRLPYSFSRAEQKEIVALAHQQQKKVVVAVNGIMHPEKMKTVPDYLDFLENIQVDGVAVGDPGVIFTMGQRQLSYPFIYDGETMVTSSRQINFWAKKGAVGAVLAREVPFEEMENMAANLSVPTEILVYGATCIHQSKRPLLDNYYSYKKLNEDVSKERGLFLAEPKKEDTHYSIYEDSHGTHIFANNDLNLVNELPQLEATGYTTWKLDGVFTPGENFVAIAACFVEAKKALNTGTWNSELAMRLTEKIHALHPKERGLDTGFFYLNPDEIK